MFGSLLIKLVQTNDRTRGNVIVAHSQSIDSAVTSCKKFVSIASARGAADRNWRKTEAAAELGKLQKGQITTPLLTERTSFFENPVLVFKIYTFVETVFGVHVAGFGA